MRISSFLSVIFLSALFAPQSTPAGQELDTPYSEHQPLAVDSLLLDVARSGERLVGVGERGHVVLSDDGLNWWQAEVVPTRSTLTTVTSIGDRLWAAGHDSVIMTSGDRGNTWTLQHFDPERRQPIMDLNMTDSMHGVAIGAYGLMLVTRDGGLNWEDTLVDDESDFHLNDMLVYGDGRRMIAGEAGYSYRSYDNGQSWESIELPYLGSMWGALDTGDGCVLFYGLRGHILKSCDFGSTWQELESGSLASLSHAAIHDSGVIFVGNSGAILLLDGFGGFETLTHSSGVDFSAVLAVGEGRFLLVGEEGVHHFPEQESGS
jgi:photosystem II stability/assembly factor-like uncharacterized protein